MRRPSGMPDMPRRCFVGDKAHPAFEGALGMSPAALAEYAEAAASIPAGLQSTAPGRPYPVFDFVLGLNTRGKRSGSRERSSHL